MVDNKRLKDKYTVERCALTAKFFKPQAPGKQTEAPTRSDSESHSNSNSDGEAASSSTAVPPCEPVAEARPAAGTKPRESTTSSRAPPRTASSAPKLSRKQLRDLERARELDELGRDPE